MLLFLNGAGNTMLYKLYYASLFSIICTASFATESHHQCYAPSIMSLTDRGTVTDTPCVVPNTKVLIEGGVQYQLLTPAGTLQNAPVTQLSLGLPAHSEVFVQVPNYNRTSTPALSGFSTTTLGGKHEVIATDDWIVSVQGLVNLPGGSQVFGSQGTGASLNGIALYALTPAISVGLMVGGSTLTTPSLFGGERCNSINPSFNLAYSPIPTFYLFAEAFGQSTIGPNLGSGFMGDAGLIYQLGSKAAVDIEFGQRLTSLAPGGIEHYVGAGITVVS